MCNDYYNNDAVDVEKQGAHCDSYLTLILNTSDQVLAYVIIFYFVVIVLTGTL